MDMAARVALQMVNDLAVVVAVKIVIRHERVGADRGTGKHVFADIAAKLRPSSIRNHLELYARRFPALSALKYALNRGFLNPGIAYSRAAILVHVAGLCSDVGFVRFTNAFHFDD